MRPIDADELKKDLTRFYDNEVTAKQLIDEQPTIEPEQRWIPVSERLPEERGLYLTTTKNKEVYCDYWNEDNFDRTEMVIAWMPLPEPYQEGEQE